MTIERISRFAAYYLDGDEPKSNSMDEKISSIVSRAPLLLAEIVEGKWSLEVLEKIKPYFLTPYEDCSYSRKTRVIDGKSYVVERFNHGLAHGLRQGVLAKDIFDLLLRLKKENRLRNLCENEPILAWAEKKAEEDPNFMQKLELVSSFQRSGRQSEVSSSDNISLYKKYERQDSINFTKVAKESGIFVNEEEIRTFAESMLMLNPGTLDPFKNEDLKYIKCILQSAHTFDLRRVGGFDVDRIKKTGIAQLFTGGGFWSFQEEYAKVREALWDRSGKYLQVTGDRDLETRRDLQDAFFLQTPTEIVEAIYRVRSVVLDI
ncbi:MAG: SidE phosphodiesterase domain-containing protein [Chlamydiota bacterium]